MMMMIIIINFIHTAPFIQWFVSVPVTVVALRGLIATAVIAMPMVAFTALAEEA